MGVLSIAGGILLAFFILAVFVIVVGLIVTYPEFAKQQYRDKQNEMKENDTNKVGTYATEETKKLEQQVKTFNDCMNKTGDHWYCRDQRNES